MQPRLYLEKSILLIVIILSCIEITRAQENSLPNSWIAGGGLSFTMQQNDAPTVLSSSNGSFAFLYGSSAEESKNTTFRFSPYIGKEVSPHWVFGLQARYGIRRFRASDVLYNLSIGQSDTVDVKRNENHYGIGLFGRYVFNPDNQFVFYVQPGINYLVTDYVAFVDDIQDGKFESNSFDIGASIGALYELSESFRLTANLGVLEYSTGHWQDTETEEESNFSSFTTAINLSSLFFGFEARF